MTSAAEIALWMMNHIRERAPKAVYQSTVVATIRSTYGAEWSYTNDNGNWAIDRKVLAEFKKIKTPDVVWNMGGQYWHIPTPERLAAIREHEARVKARREEIKARRAAI